MRLQTQLFIVILGKWKDWFLNVCKPAFVYASERCDFQTLWCGSFLLFFFILSCKTLKKSFQFRFIRICSSKGGSDRLENLERKENEWNWPSLMLVRFLMELFDNFWLLAKCIIICGDFLTTIERIKVGIVPNFGSKRKTTRLATSTGIICSPPYVTDDWAIFTHPTKPKIHKKKPKNSGKFFLMLISRVQRTFQETTSIFYGHPDSISVSWEAKLFDFIISNSHLTAILTEAILQVTTSFSTSFDHPTSYLFLISRSTLLQSNFNCTWSVVTVQTFSRKIEMHVKMVWEIWEIENCFSWDVCKSIKRENCVVVAPSRIPFLLMPLSFTIDFATHSS